MCECDVEVIQLTTNSRQTHDKDKLTTLHIAQYRISRHLTTMLTTPHDKLMTMLTTPRDKLTTSSRQPSRHTHDISRQLSRQTHDMPQPKLKKLPVLQMFFGRRYNEDRSLLKKNMDVRGCTINKLVHLLFGLASK